MACGSANEPVDHVSTRAGVCQLRDFTGINFPSASLYQAIPFNVGKKAESFFYISRGR